MKQLIVGLSLLLISFQSISAQSLPKYFGNGLCKHPDFHCIKSPVNGWEKAFPDPIQRDIIQKVNRTYNSLWRGKTLAIPNNIENITLLDVSPFPLSQANIGEKKIIVDQEKLAWAAYDEEGMQVRWGPIASGKDYCPDIGKQCTTQTGEFRFFSKQGSECRSKTYDGARMPYCMFFYKGFAMHGSHDIPGKRASHGCIRMFTRDAKWLNLDFIELSHSGNNERGTKVIVRKLLHYN